MSLLIIVEILHAPLGSVQVGHNNEVSGNHNEFHAREAILLNPVKASSLLKIRLALTYRHLLLQFTVKQQLLAYSLGCQVADIVLSSLVLCNDIDEHPLVASLFVPFIAL